MILNTRARRLQRNKIPNNYIRAPVRMFFTSVFMTRLPPPAYTENDSGRPLRNEIKPFSLLVIRIASFLFFILLILCYFVIVDKFSLHEHIKTNYTTIVVVILPRGSLLRHF